MYNSELRLINAYLYEDYIAVTTTIQFRTGKPAYCHFYDCHQQEISNSTWRSSFFPLNIVYCVRRAGAKYISISLEKHSVAEKPPIPMIFRAYKD